MMSVFEVRVGLGSLGNVVVVVVGGGTIVCIVISMRCLVELEVG